MQVVNDLLRLEPTAFWAMTPREFFIMAGGLRRQDTPGRADLTRLMASFPDTTFGLHLCRGNHRSMWSVEGGYDEIAEQLFKEIAVERLLLEYDSPRSGDFGPLRFVPAGKTVVLGLITTKEPEVETGELLKRRIEEAAAFLPLDQLALSPQCGFASTLPGNRVTEDVQRRKLEVLGEVAREVWPE